MNGGQILVPIDEMSRQALRDEWFAMLCAAEALCFDPGEALRMVLATARGSAIHDALDDIRKNAEGVIASLPQSSIRYFVQMPNGQFVKSLKWQLGRGAVAETTRLTDKARSYAREASARAIAARVGGEVVGIWSSSS